MWLRVKWRNALSFDDDIPLQFVIPLICCFIIDSQPVMHACFLYFLAGYAMVDGWLKL